MSLLPNKYVPIEFSMLGVVALLMEQLEVNDTISSLWDRISREPQVRTFDRYADGLTVLYAANLIDIKNGIIHKVESGTP